MGSFEISEAWLVIIIIIIAIARVVTGGAIQQFLWNALARDPFFSKVEKKIHCSP